MNHTNSHTMGEVINAGMCESMPPSHKDASRPVCGRVDGEAGVWSLMG